jgi:hypothetical protein
LIKEVQMTIQDLYGIWHLISFYAENQVGERNYYFGEDASGRLIYHPEGYVTAFLMRKGRRSLSNGVAEGTLAEIKEAFDGFEAYSGKFSVDFDAGIVTHHVDLARLPAYEGSDQVRYFKMEDGVLSIYTPPVVIDDQEWVFYIKWEKRS